MVNASALSSLLSSSFHNRKHVTISLTSFYHSYRNFNKHLSLPTHFFFRPFNSPQHSKLHSPNVKSPPLPLSKTHIWVDPKTHNNSYYGDTSSIVKLAKSLDFCNPTEQRVSEILKGNLGDNVTERDAVFILNRMMKPNNALFVLEYFIQKFQPVSHVILYNVTMKLFGKIKQFDGAEKLFDEMLQRGVKPNLSTFSTIISCASLCSIPHKAVEWFEMMPSFECKPDGKLLSSMISPYARTGNADMALKLYDCAKKEKWNIDIVTFSALIKMCGKSGNYDGCLSVYKDMKVLCAKPNLAIYNNLLHAMGRAKRTGETKAIYEEMINNGVSPNQSSYAAVLQAYCRGRYKEGALSVYKKMKEKRSDIDKVLYNMLLDMCADVGCADEAIEIFEDMKRSPTCQPDSVTYSSLFNMYSRTGKVSEAEAMLNEMMDCGFEPNIRVLTSLVGCYGKAKQTDDVVRIFNQLLDLGIAPDDRLSDCLLYVMTQIPKLDHDKITYCIEKANPKLGSLVGHLVEKQEGDGDLRKEASELLNSIDDHGLRKSLCSSLIDLCVNLDFPDRAHDLLDLGLVLEIYTDIQSKSQIKWSLNLKGLSSGTSLTALHVWINDLSKALVSGEELPPQLGIFIGPRRHKSSATAIVIESYLKEHNAPFQKDTDMVGWFLTTKEAVKSWLQSSFPTTALSH